MSHHLIVIGAEGLATRLRAAGLTDVVALPDAPTGSVFDEATHTWELSTKSGESHRTRIVISSTPPEDRGLRPYLGVAVHGIPNYFISDTSCEERTRYLVECLRLMERTRSTRIEVRYSTQRMFHDRAKPGSAVNWRRMRNKIRSAFDLSSHVGVEDEVYDGPATIRIGDDEHAVRVRLTGHLEPIDGRYHWRGTVFGALPEAQRVILTIGERTAEARITEQTPWGSYSVAGVGAPPFRLDDVELTVPGR
jgi:hypothetical protein